MELERDRERNLQIVKHRLEIRLKLECVQGYLDERCNSSYPEEKENSWQSSQTSLATSPSQQRRTTVILKRDYNHLAT